jgi:hypothetical protein
VRATVVTRPVYPSRHRLDGQPGVTECEREAKTALTDAIAKWMIEHGERFDFARGRVTLTWRDFVVEAEAKAP